jgi:capsular polysaccharide transport system permease protein
MTTTPKATRFHIRRPQPPAPRPDTPSAGMFDTQEDGFGDVDFRGPAPGASAATAPAASATVLKVPRATSDEDVEAIAAIAAEGLTGRQLRRARMVADKHRVVARSDYEAIYLLRRAGIDPFSRASLLDMVRAGVGPDPDGSTETPTEDLAATAAPEPDGTAPTSRALAALPGDVVRLPQKMQPIRVPSTEQRAEVNQAAEILRMQEDIARRRRRKLALLAARMFVFVFLPTLLAGWYYYAIATPLYATKSAFVIQQAGPSGGGALGGLFSGTALAKSEDSVNVQDYLQSREAMARLEKDVGFRSHFQDEKIDLLQRLPPGASLEKAYRVYKKFVKISYDPTEGIIRMEVVAADPVVASAWSEQLISYAEEQVDHLTQRMREDQMEDALASHEEAKTALKTAQRTLIELQENFKVLSSEAEVGMLTAQISQMEGQVTQERLSLAQMESNENPNQARMDPVKRRIATLETQIAALRAKMTEGSVGSESLAQVQGELLMAQADVQTRQLILAQTLQSMEVARTEANRQVRYLSVSVNPTITDEPAYPRAFENTLVTMLILLGIYLMVSMTAAILREQVTA